MRTIIFSFFLTLTFIAGVVFGSSGIAASYADNPDSLAYRQHRLLERQVKAEETQAKYMKEVVAHMRAIEKKL